MKNQPRQNDARLKLAGTLALIAGLLPACARVPVLSGSRAVRVIQPEDFVPGVPAEQSPAQSWAVDSPPLPAGEQHQPIVSVRPGPPTPQPSNAAPVEAPMLVESKIGDINGKPIYASSFLEPLADRLRAEAAQMTPQRWEPFAKDQIERRLEDIITDELLRAEALSRLTPEQKQGFRAFLDAMNKERISQAGGSRALAGRRLSEKEGISEDEFIRRREQEALIRNTLIQEINSRVNISWRDIRQRYQRDWKLYNPPPSATLRLIRIPTASTADVQAVNDALAAGTPFDEAAFASATNYKPEQGGLDQFPLEGSYEQTAFYGSAILNEKARSLTPGQWTGPFETGSQTAWLKLEDITTESVSIYEAQLAINDQLLRERRNEELRRYLDRLERRASFTSLSQMRNRLFEIAQARFAGPAPSTPTP